MLRNNIYIMTLIFAGVAVWAGIRWEQLALIQKLNLGAYLWLVIHEYEEGYKNRFVYLFAVSMGIDPTEAIATGRSHIAQACGITLLFCSAMCFPDVQGLTFAGFILCIFEGFVHTMGIRLFRLGKPSPGWYTAVLMCAYAIWAIVYFYSHAACDGIQWLWGVLFFVGVFAVMQNCYVRLMGSSISRLKNGMLALAKQNLLSRK